MRRFEGFVAFVGVTTNDNRQIDELQIDAPLPVLSAPDARLGERRSYGVGRVVEQRGDGVWVAGEVDLPSGEYAVGVELDRVYLTQEPDANGMMRFGGTATCVVAYDPDSGQTAPWPDAKIAVSE